MAQLWQQLSGAAGLTGRLLESVAAGLQVEVLHPRPDIPLPSICSWVMMLLLCVCSFGIMMCEVYTRQVSGCARRRRNVCSICARQLQGRQGWQIKSRSQSTNHSVSTGSMVMSLLPQRAAGRASHGLSAHSHTLAYKACRVVTEVGLCVPCDVQVAYPRLRYGQIYHQVGCRHLRAQKLLPASSADEPRWLPTRWSG